MVVNSLSFLIFFLLVFTLYYSLLREKTRAQNWLLLFASYVFYGFADYEMIPLLIIATVVFYVLGIVIYKTSNTKKSTWLLLFGLLLGIGVLLYFKYLNFFIESFASLFNAIGLHTNWGTFNIVIPLGISFFTFKLISYLIEIYRGKMEPCKDIIAFSTYVAFFPTIMSGPIDRPDIFIPQLQKKRSFDYDLEVDGYRQILWGIFKKAVIADNLAAFTERAWGNIQGLSGSTLLLAAFFYSIQLYADFSGYSDMAIGVGKILGFRITKNFNYPFFATNIAEYWRRWHISLTSWLTDYVFMPLNIMFRNLRNWGIILAIIITMIVVGLWHGANFTFFVFGLYHGLLFIPLILSGSFFKNKKQKTNKYGLPGLSDFSKMLGIFILVTLGLMIFRAENIGQVLNYLSVIFSQSLFSLPQGKGQALIFILISALLLLLEWYGREQEYALAYLGTKLKKPYRYAIYYAIIIVIFWFGGKEQQFIYFQF